MHRIGLTSGRTGRSPRSARDGRIGDTPTAPSNRRTTPCRGARRKPWTATSTPVSSRSDDGQIYPVNRHRHGSHSPNAAPHRRFHSLPTGNRTRNFRMISRANGTAAKRPSCSDLNTARFRPSRAMLGRTRNANPVRQTRRATPSIDRNVVIGEIATRRVADPVAPMTIGHHRPAAEASRPPSRRPSGRHPATRGSPPSARRADVTVGPRPQPSRALVIGTSTPITWFEMAAILASTLRASGLSSPRVCGAIRSAPVDGGC